MRNSTSIFLFSVLLAAFILLSCKNEQKKGMYDETASGVVNIAYPEHLGDAFNSIIDELNEEYPLIKVNAREIGSIDYIRELANKKDSCDILVYDDYFLAEDFLIPDITRWIMKFARDEIVIAYLENSPFLDEYNTSEWYKTLLNTGVKFGRMDTENTSCGYRTVSVFKLAGRYNENQDLTHELLTKNRELSFHTSEELLGALKNGQIDYAVLYKSMAESNDMDYLSIPMIMNLNHPNLRNYYDRISVNILGKESVKPYTVDGAPIIYGLTIMNNTPNLNNSLILSEYILSRNKGLSYLSNKGISPMIPSENEYYEDLPGSLKKFSMK